jgi:predicted transcriptional regulator
VIDLLRCVMRLPGPMVDRLDRIANEASRALRCEVSRAAVVRAAIEVWLDVIERGSRQQFIERIRASTMKRGRKRQ